MAKGKKADQPGTDFDVGARAVERDGGIIGDPGGYRFATGGKKPDLRGVGEEMLRGRYGSSGRPPNGG